MFSDVSCVGDNDHLVSCLPMYSCTGSGQLVIHLWTCLGSFNMTLWFRCGWALFDLVIVGWRWPLFHCTCDFELWQENALKHCVSLYIQWPLISSCSDLAATALVQPFISAARLGNPSDHFDDEWLTCGVSVVTWPLWRVYRLSYID